MNHTSDKPIKKTSGFDFHSHISEYVNGGVLGIIIILIFVNIINNKLQYFRKMSRFFHVILQPTIMYTYIGMFIGFVLNFCQEKETVEAIKLSFQEFFMIFFLPPIIFEAALKTNLKFFFKNIGTIIIFAFFGTVVNILLLTWGWYIVCFIFSSTVSMLSTSTNQKSWTMEESAAFGSLYSATDPVQILAFFKETTIDKDLSSLIFGESILNDAVGLIAFQ